MAKTKIQLVIDEDLLPLGEKLARQNGLNSFQDLIRFWTVQAIKGNLTVNTDFSEPIEEE